MTALKVGFLIALLGWTCSRLFIRWREEKADHHVMLLADWSEAHDLAARLGLGDDELLARLGDSGASGLLVGAATVQDYLRPNFTFASRVQAEAVLRQLQDRSVSGVSLKEESKTFRLVNSLNTWDTLKDMEVGFNPELLGKARQAGFHLVLRINNDPWLSEEKLFQELQEIGSANEELGFLLNTDDCPGGKEALPVWASFLTSQNYAQLLFEFHPTKSAMKLAIRSPKTTWRAHTIAPNELKDLDDVQQKARWLRAVQERSCRFLLVHAAAGDSLPGFLASIHTLRENVAQDGWDIAWPAPRVTWSFPSFFARAIAPFIALWTAILAPIVALWASLKYPPWTAFARVTILTLVGACIMAAVAQNPWTRLEIIPFKGIKPAFALAWLGCWGVLYSWTEIKSALLKNVRRLDIVAGMILAAAAGYLLIRMGNAGSAWQAGSEQKIRDWLETLFVARPRFKEFAIGYPLLLLGLHLRAGAKPKSFWTDGRFWIGVGMIGPISMVNTFCHLHSPLYLAFWRSANGFLLGTALGCVLLVLAQGRLKSR